MALAVLVLTFGVMFPLLGFYWDDWSAVGAARLKGISSFWEFYRGERPFSAWTYILTMPWLGTKPLTWHIVSLILRWLTVLAMWWTLRGIWPKRSREVTWIALLFAIYPVFINQSIALAFSQHWMTFLLYFISLGLMIQSIRKPRYFWVFTILALLTEVIHVMTMEYFWGLELIRPFILWIVLSENISAKKDRLIKTLLYWSPYFLVLVAGFVLRMTVFVDLSKDPNEPTLLYALKTQPITSSLQFIQFAIQDLISNLAGSWYNTVTPGEIQFNDRVYLFSMVISIVVAGSMFYYLDHFTPSKTGEDATRRTWIKQALLIGIILSLLGPIPVWLSNRQVSWGLYGGRFGLAAEFGLSILLIAIIDWFTEKPLPKILLVSVLIGVASGYHIRIASTYYRSTLRQEQFYWQLYWRAPFIKPNTAILSSDELFIYVGRSPTAVTLNLLYPQPDDSNTQAYWFLELGHDIGPEVVPKLVRGRPLNATFRKFNFSGNSQDSLVIFYKPGTGRCLWILSPEDTDVPGLSEYTLQALPVTNLDRIENTPVSKKYPDQSLFGKEPSHDWCYYFQKADLARQYGDWGKVIQLGEQAIQEGYSPADANEWIPFIQAYANTGQWKDAIQRTKQSLALQAEIAPRLCNTWGRILSESSPTAVEQQNINELLKSMSCTPPTTQ